jgi:thiaminase
MASPSKAWSLTSHLLATQEHLFKSATQHPFLLAAAEGQLPKETLSRWLANDRLYIHSYIRAAGKLLASIDLPKQVPGSQEAFETQLADWLIEALVAIRKEERFFLDVAERYGLGLELVFPLPPASQLAAASQDVVPSQQDKLPGLVQLESIFSSVATPPATAPPSQDSPSKVPGVALVQSLFTTTTTTTGATTPPTLLPWLEGALTFWGTERCYLEAWSWARDKAAERRESGEHAGKEDRDGGALRKEFIPNWSSPGFEQFVDKLGRLVDEAVAEVLEGKEGEERERVKGEILGRVEGPWRTLLEAEREFWPDL